MVAGGSGITPMYQIIQAVANNKGDQTELAILFANKTEVYRIFKFLVRYTLVQ